MDDAQLLGCLGVKETPREVLDRRIVAQDDERRTLGELVNIPPELSLRTKMTPVKDQGQGLYCALFACLAAAEYLIANDANRPIQTDLSESHLSHAAEKLAKSDCLGGMSIGTPLMVLEYNGVVPSTSWSYDPEIICNPRPPSLHGVRRYFLDQFPGPLVHRTTAEVVARARSPGSDNDAAVVRAAVAKYRAPVLVDVPVFLDCGWGNGTIDMPARSAVLQWLEREANQPDGSKSWHAIPICGYDNATRRFLFKNSWGRGWGDRGFGTVSYEYIEAYVRSIWSTTGSYHTLDGVPSGGI